MDAKQQTLTSTRFWEKYVEKKEEPKPEPVPEVTEPTTGNNTFLWKPISESNGRLVILFPFSLRGKMKSGLIEYNGGREKGVFATDTHNGNRPHYRFNHAGGHYGGPCVAIAELLDGTYKQWNIPNGAERKEY